MVKTLRRSGAVKRSVAAKTAKSAKSAAAHILAAPKGPRTVSHRRIKDAVEKVFRERSTAGV